MIPWLLLLPLPVARAAEVVGVPPSLQASYAPSASGSWKCLDGSKEIPWKFVNDDSCDCPDGSDEPGSDASERSLHWRQHTEFKSGETGFASLNAATAQMNGQASVRTSVFEVGKEYRKKRAEELKIQKTGAKIRSTYVAFAEKEKKRPRGRYPDLVSRDHRSRERSCEIARHLPTVTESLSAAELEYKKESQTDSEPEEVIPEGEWTAVQLEKDLPKLLKTDYVSLLLEHDEHVIHQRKDLCLSNYLPDALIPQYEDFKDTLLGWMETIGVIRPSVGVSTEATHAQQALNDAKNSLRKVEKEKQTAEEDLQKISDSVTFGPQASGRSSTGHVWKRTSESHVSVRSFEAEAKKGGTTFNLGKFSSWNPDAEPGTPEYYEKQMYTKGTKCWNGPERSLLLVMTCGTENVIHTVAELEKCQYQFTGTSPALCLPVSEGVKHEEL
ncbi:hypothetical protein BDZ89DRAFT_1160374 [Hymenopellis radicata]|nr:hypothetical protein BDZ89DRAFT_1160374 [Hymenopellis radicata]